jgi:hypothetical protein
MVAGGLVASAVAGAVLAAVGVEIIVVGAPHDALTAAPATVLALVRHNAVVALWPLALVWLGWPAIPVARTTGDALAAGQVLLHGAVLGSALAQQPGLWRYLPHLPFEFAALALPVAAWITARRSGEVNPTRLAGTVAAVLALVLAAAVLESYLVPIG